MCLLACVCVVQLVTLVGSNFGPMNPAVPATFNVTYGGPSGTLYPAIGCALAVPGNNTRLQCITTEGSGTAHVWKVRPLLLLPPPPTIVYLFGHGLVTQCEA